MAWELWSAEAGEVLAAKLGQAKADTEPVGKHSDFVKLHGLPVCFRSVTYPTLLVINPLPLSAPIQGGGLYSSVTGGLPRVVLIKMCSLL